MKSYADNSTESLKLSLKMIERRCPDYPNFKTNQIIEELKRRLSYPEFLELINKL